MSEPPEDPVIGESAGDEGAASVILVEPRDDIAAVCGRVDSAPTFAVIVHAPKGNRALSTQLGMRRLQKHAEDSGRIVAIATRSGALAARARQTRVPVASRPGRVRWDAGGRKVFHLGWGRSVILPALGGFVPFAAVAAVVIVVATLGLTMAPSGEVILAPPAETLEKTVTIAASRDRSSVDLARLLVPAQDVTSSQTITLVAPATGKAVVPVQPAKAALTLTNASAKDVRVPLRAIVIGPAGNFALDQETLVAAGKTAPATATALQPGKAGNVAGGTLKAWQDAAFKDIAVVNQAAASGGTDEERPAVDAKDLELLATLAAGLEKSPAVQAKVLSVRAKDVVFLNTAKTSVEAGAASAAAGAPADLVLLDVKVTVTALAITAETLDAVARGVLTAGRGEGELVPGSVGAVETGVRQLNSDDGSVRTEIKVTGRFASNVDRDGIRDAVKGKSEEEARSTVGSPGTELEFAL